MPPPPGRESLPLPYLKQEELPNIPSMEPPCPAFQYVLCAATSPAVKQREETLTYLNQGTPGLGRRGVGEASSGGCARGAGEAGTISVPQSGAHTSPQSLSGQSYEVQMLCNSKLGDAPQWPRLLKVGASPPRSGAGCPYWAGGQCHHCDVIVK